MLNGSTTSQRGAGLTVGGVQAAGGVALVVAPERLRPPHSGGRAKPPYSG
jgi:hypothetical protein